MKFFLQMCSLFYCLAVLANEKSIELNSENLTLLALKNSSQEVLSEYVLSEVKLKHSNEYFKLIKKPNELKLLIEKVKQDVEMSISNLSDQQLFTQELTTKFVLNKNNPKINISSLFPTFHFPILRNHNQHNTRSKYLNLIIANFKIIYGIEIDEIKKEELLNKNLKNIYLNINYAVSKYQNERNFQSIIQSIDIYEDKNKSLLITTINEKESYNDIVDNWVLSEGFSTNLTGIHAFTFLGYRLQDQIYKSYILNNLCEKSQIINKHRVLICKYDFTNNSFIRATFIGGVLAQIDLIANQNIQLLEAKSILKKLSSGFKDKKFNVTSEQYFWTKHNANFNYYSGWFNSTVPELNAVDDIDKYKLVFSMSAHRTNKLFEEIK